MGSFRYLKLPTDLEGSSKGQLYKQGQTINTIAGNAMVDVQFADFEPIKPYRLTLREGKNSLPLPWGYILTYA